MGLSIHYRGKFNRKAILANLITEVLEIAETLKWDYKVFNDTFPKNEPENQTHDGNIYGISFTPPDCETVSICFLSNYRMSSHTHLKFFGNTADKQEQELLYMLFVKTQFAGVAVHKTIVEIFRHLKKKAYFEELIINDGAKYFPTDTLPSEIFLNFRG